MQDKISKNIAHLLNESELNKLAKESKYYVKNNGSLLTAFAFLMSNLYACMYSLHFSLENMSSYLSTHFNICISKQALNQRYNSRSLGFVQLVFRELSKRLYLDSMVNLGVHFSAIRILDSTIFQIQEKFKKHYVGFGGSGSSAGLKIQQEIDLLGNQHYLAYLHSGKDNDNQYRELHPIKANELIVRDLGYWNQSYFAKVHQSGAYFLSRFHYSTKKVLVKDKAGKLIATPIIDIIKNFLKTSSKLKSLTVYIADEKTPVRLVIDKLPDEVVEKRLRAKEKKHRKKLDNAYKLFNQVNLYMTNASEEKLPLKAIRTIYRVRWQIELLFKTWKSYYQIEDYKDMSVARFEVLLFCKLIWIMIAFRTYIIAQCERVEQIKTQKAKHLVSLMKTMKEFCFNRIELFLEAFKSQCQEKIHTQFHNFYVYVSKKIKMDTKKEQICTLEALLINYA